MAGTTEGIQLLLEEMEKAAGYDSKFDSKHVSLSYTQMALEFSNKYKTLNFRKEVPTAGKYLIAIKT